MVSHFIYKCTLFLACRWRHFFSIFARVHRSRDVSFLYFYTSVSNMLPRILETTVLDGFENRNSIIPDHLLATRKAFKSKTFQTKLTTHNQLEQRHTSPSARGELHGRTSQQQCSSGRPRLMQAETRNRHLLEVRRAAAGGLDHAV